MGNEKRKKKRGSGTDGQREWSDLPELPLAFILDRLVSLPDLLAFAGVCRSWRTLSKSKPNSAALPPALLSPILQWHRRKWRWANPTRCRLHTSINESASYWCPVSPSTLHRSCIGYSFGSLIFITGRRPFIADVFTGHEIQAPILLQDYGDYTLGFLTAPPSSPVCRLLMSGFGCRLLCWQLGDEEWTEIPLGRGVVPPIYQVLPFRGRLHALDLCGRLLTFRSSPQPSVDICEFQLERTKPLLSLPMRSFSGQLVECGGELLLVRFKTILGQLFQIKVEVYRLDSDATSWVKVERLGDSALFMNTRGTCQAAACLESARWGGRSNCVYITGPGCDTWTVLHLDDPLIDCLSDESPFSPAKEALPSWPSPLWVHPSSMFFEEALVNIS